MPGYLLGIAFLVSLFIQTTSTPLIGMWLFLLLAACASAYEKRHSEPLRLACIAWLAAVGLSTFFLAPVPGGATTFWMLSAMPLIAISFDHKAIPKALDAVLAVIVLYAFGLVIQTFLGVQYTNFNYAKSGLVVTAWPLLDPNNAACVINCALVPCFWRTLRRPKWGFPTLVLLSGLMVTQSKAGLVAALIAFSIILAEAVGAWILYAIVALAMMLWPTVEQPFTKAFMDRVAIWHISARLLDVFPLTGLGPGSFIQYYQKVVKPDEIHVYFAHNDLLQFVLELGWPVTAVFVALLATIVVTTNRKNIASACAFLVIFLQAMVEFQFYVPAVSMLGGLALAHHLTLGNANLTLNRLNIITRRWRHPCVRSSIS